MKLRERKKLIKIIDKAYWPTQRLYIETMQVRDKSSCCLDICLFSKEKKEFGEYLFQIQNYFVFNQWDFRNNYLVNKYFLKIDITNKPTSFDVKAASTPFYFDRVYTLSKFTFITDKDILSCTRHFIDKVLDNWPIFNIEVIKEERK